VRIWIPLAATVALFLVLSLPLAVPGGIVAFEFADSAEEVRSIIQGWKDQGAMLRAYWNLWVDFAFIVAYVALGILVDRRLRLGYTVAAAVLAAGTLDVIENVTLLRELSGEIHVGTVHLASTCARWKFALLGLAAVIACGGLLFRALRKPAPAARGNDGSNAAG